MSGAQLRIYLGAAPGVGKTYAMLAEGHRRLERGADVVVGLVEDHGRVHTVELLYGLEVLPRRTFSMQGKDFSDLDREAVLLRRPTLVLVDELAHTNPPGGRNAYRWQDVEELLAAGIEVISTLNVQQLESLSDAVTAITGVRPQETVPDELVRRADQIELVDMSPEALRRRVAHGNVYGPEQVDAALANYFRVGNLTALRELALLWLADRVDEGLVRYRTEHSIEGTWAARERIVVAVKGGPASDALVRRATRIAGRASGGELLAVHVAASHGRAGPAPERLASLESQRLLVEKLGGSFHTVLGLDVASAVLQFARGVNATQVVLGAGPARPLRSLLAPDVVAGVVKGAGDIDVLLVTREDADGTGRGDPRRQLPARRVGRRRLLAGGALAVSGPLVLTWVLTLLADQLSLPSELLLMLALTVGVALLGGLWPALASAVLGTLLINFYFTPPFHTFSIEKRENALALAIFVAVAVAVAGVVDLAARRSAEAAHSQSEAATLGTLAGSALRGDDSVESLLEQLRTTFAMVSVGLFERADERAPWHLVAAAGDAADGAAPGAGDVEAAVSADLVVVGRGGPLAADDQRVLQAYAAHVGVVLQRERLTARALEAERLEQGSVIRTALLAAVSHDLRTPLAGIKAAVSSLRQEDVDWSSADEAALLATVEESADRLTALVANLLDMSRLQTGSVQPQLGPVALEEIVPPALLGLDPVAELVVQVPESLPLVVGDAGLLERVVANLVENAVRHGGATTPVLVSASISVLGEYVEVRIVDRGPGVPDAVKEQMFAPFHRLGDGPSGPGVGLGLAVARGFTEATGGRLWAEDTPGGGLTMVLELPVAAVQA